MGNKNFFKKLFLKHLTNGEKDSIIDKLNKARPVGQAVKTLASHAENMGSIPVRVTNKNLNRFIRFRFFLYSKRRIYLCKKMSAH